MATAYQGQNLTPLARVLEYQTSSFDNRISFLAEEKNRIERNRLLAEQQKYKLAEYETKWEYTKKELDYRLNAEQETRLAQEALRGEYDLAQERLKQQGKQAEIGLDVAKTIAKKEAELSFEKQNLFAAEKEMLEALGDYSAIGLTLPKPVFNERTNMVEYVLPKNNNGFEGATFSTISEAVNFYNPIVNAIKSIDGYLSQPNLEQESYELGGVRYEGSQDLIRRKKAILTGAYNLADVVNQSSYRTNIRMRETNYDKQKQIDNIPISLTEIERTAPYVFDNEDLRGKTIAQQIAYIQDEYENEISKDAPPSTIKDYYNAIKFLSTGANIGEKRFDPNQIIIDINGNLLDLQRNPVQVSPRTVRQSTVDFVNQNSR